MDTTTIDEVLQAVKTAKNIEEGQRTIEEIAGSDQPRKIQEKINDLTKKIIDALKTFQAEEHEQLEKLFKDAKNPVTLSMPIDRKKHPYTSALLLYQCEQTTLAPDQEKSPYADHFPGPIAEDATPVKNAEVEVTFDFMDLSYLRMLVAPGNWQSTGLYAPAGENITIEVPDHVKNLDVQIGAHTDGLGHLTEWDRAPIITFK